MRTESRSSTAPLADSRRQSEPQWPNSPEQIHRYPSISKVRSGPLVGSPSRQNASINNAPNSPDDYTLTTNNMSPAETTTQQIMSPEMSTSAATQFSLGSNDSIVPRSTTSQPTFNVAISRWFDMLVGDASFESATTLNFEAGYTERATVERDPDLNGIPYMGRSYSNPDDAAIAAASPSSSSPQLLERTAPGPDRNAISEKMQWQAPDVIELLPYEQFIFRNFVQRISLWIDLFDPTRSFSTFVPHLATRNLGLMKSILALSARHISLNPSLAGEQTHDRNDALQYYQETLQYLFKAMQYDTYKTSLELLATVLIVSTYEMLDGSGKDWERHLQGVFWIQRSQVIHGDSKGLKQAVWWAWLCQDIWAAFREKRKTFTFWKPTRTFSDMNPFELAARSVYVIAKVVNYCSREENEGSDLPSRMERADQLQAMLDEWEKYLTTEFCPLPFRPEERTNAFQPVWIHPPPFGRWSNWIENSMLTI